MLKPQNIGSFDTRITIQSPTQDDSTGERVEIWADTYIHVFAREVEAAGTESSEQSQVVARRKRAWVIRKHNRQLTEQMRVVLDDQYFYITAVHRYGTDRANLVLECESRDNY